MTKKIPLIAGNWKMNLGIKEGERLALHYREVLERLPGIEVALFPTFLQLPGIAKALEGSRIGYGSQDAYHEPAGAFTGEIPLQQLKELGCRFVIVGHSERRHVIGESPELVAAKARAVVTGGLTPILCVGEKNEERQAGRANQVVINQLEEGLFNWTTDTLERIIIAYEPVWAIGTGLNAQPADIREMHQLISRWLDKKAGPEVSGRCRIIYGGSVNADNISEIAATPQVDGVLVGGASLKSSAFTKIAQTFAPPSR